MSKSFKPGDRVRVLAPQSTEGSTRFQVGDTAVVIESEHAGPDEVCVDGYFYLVGDLELVDPLRDAFDKVMNGGYREILKDKLDGLAALPKRYGDPHGGYYVLEPGTDREEIVPFDSERAKEIRVTNVRTGGQKGSKAQRFSLLPWDVLGKLAEHYDKGSRKYSPHNWRKGYDWSLSIDALGRHFAAFIEGEDIDPETGSHHMLAVMFHAAALVYFTDACPELDDRRNSVKDDNANAHG